MDGASLLLLLMTLPYSAVAAAAAAAAGRGLAFWPERNRLEPGQQGAALKGKSTPPSLRTCCDGVCTEAPHATGRPQVFGGTEPLAA